MNFHNFSVLKRVHETTFQLGRDGVHLRLLRFKAVCAFGILLMFIQVTFLYIHDYFVKLSWQ